MTSPKIGYIPVHLLDQKVKRQLDGIQGQGVTTGLARIQKRPTPADLNHIRAGDTLVVHSRAQAGAKCEGHVQASKRPARHY